MTLFVGGVLLVYNNYTGDRINFGLAVERARSEGLRVEQFIVGEDCAAIPTQSMRDRRGIAGYIAFLKVTFVKFFPANKKRNTASTQLEILLYQ